MTRAPVVGLTLHGEAREGAPPRLILNRAYVDALEAAGAAVLPLVPSADLERLRLLYERCDALCLPGGADVQPQLYGEVVRTDCTVRSDPELDSAELALARWAVADGLPLLAICRGMQLLNVALGGTLWQDITIQVREALRHDRDGPRSELTHAMDVVAGSLLQSVTRTETLRVNSLHHQGLREVAAPLAVSARAPDGVVEAVEDPQSRFLVGVQCHPEEMTESAPWTRRLFGELVRSTGG